MSTSQNLNRLTGVMSDLWMLYNEEPDVKNVERLFAIIKTVKLVRSEMNKERELRLKNAEDHSEPLCRDLHLRTPS